MEPNNQLEKIDLAQVAVLIDSAPKALETNTTSVARAVDFGKTLLDTIQAEGMNDELDERCNGYLVKLKKTSEEMKGRRVPVTQIFDYIKTQFTTLENQLDGKNKDSIYFKIQQARDQFAAEKVEARRVAEAAAQRKLDQDKELIRLKSEAQQQLANYFNSYLSARIAKLTELFNGITLELFDSTAFTIGNFETRYPHEHFESFTPVLRPVYATGEQIRAIEIEVTEGKYGEFSTAFFAAVADAKMHIIDRLESRKIELEQIARASAEKADEMKRAADVRQRIEKERLAKESAERLAREQSKINTEAAAATTNSLFDAQEAVSQATLPCAPTRESLQIEVLNPLGYLLIAQLYFEHEGKTESIDKLENKKLGSMKTACEKLATKSGVRIDSAFIRYSDKIKTIAKK